MSRLIITRGIPASGKTTFAKMWASAAPRRVRINRDDLRFMMYGVYHGENVDEAEVTKVQHAAVMAALKAGNDVIVDDTNLNTRFVKKLIALGVRAGATVEEMQFPVDTTEAIVRNTMRERQVPVEVIRQMQDRFKNMPDFASLMPPKPRPYNGTPGKPQAVIFDVDGTLATMKGRSPFEWARVGEDEVVQNVVDTANALFYSGYTIIVLSGRDGICEPQTRIWLNLAGLEFQHLWMRAVNDQRADNIIKAELFDAHIRDNFDVKFVVDDRNQVVDMWRSMGLQCFQVQEGDF